MTALGASDRKAGGRRGKPIRILALAGCLLVALAGCSLIGDTLQRNTTPAENHKYQRITAINFRDFQPDVESITFTREGGFSGSGQWSTNAVVRIDEKDYRAILGPNVIGGEPWPDPTGSPRSPVLVRYSDGTTEELP